MTRTRSEYRLATIDPAALPAAATPLRPPTPADRAAIAHLLLDAYRGTVDDEGETLDDALEAADLWLHLAIAPHSVVLEEDGRLRALSFVVVVDDRMFIDPIVVAASATRRGLGASMVAASLRSLHTSGITEVGATITDGNVPSERLFAALGFTRVGEW